MQQKRTKNLGLVKWDDDTDELHRSQFTENFETIDDQVSSLYGSANLWFKSSTVTIGNPGSSDAYTNTDYFTKVFTRFAVQGLGAVVSTLHNLDSETGSTFQHHTAQQIQSILNIAKVKGVKLWMLKPHIVLNWSDGFSRGRYDPVDVPLHFANWTQELLFVAQLCRTNNIPWLCIECEHYKLTSENLYYSYWLQLVNTIRAAYPELKLTVAMMGSELRDTTLKLQADRAARSVVHLVDAIGANIYATYFYEPYAIVNGKPTVTVEDVARGFRRTWSGWSPYDLLVDMNQLTGKPILITEFGCMPKDDGLTQLFATGATNYDVQALLFQAYFETVVTIPFIKGFAIWHAHSPFQYFDYEGQTIYPGEKVIIDYVSSGRI
ncbi:glycoside hydrolase family 113 [Paenibacillus humicus]|uniref:glycoside hydrolase family 113 n=1 Tax=Paenibacillus humicus TaxID=412861 RepID=UPI000FDBC9AD|nr:hypothetical protein [Paenibacillus humicus]